MTMAVEGGRVVWGMRRGRGRDRGKGIVVVFGWVSVEDELLERHVDLYSSLGWSSLISLPGFLCAFYPERAFSLAFLLLRELVQELRVKPCPVVFVALSGGPKACMYKAYQIIQGKVECQLTLEEIRLIRSCLCGHIYDSGPLDFTSDLGARFALHPAFERMPGPMKIVSWFAKGVGSMIRGLYLTRFDCQRSEYWQTLYSSTELEAPYLILCSENDELAPYRVIMKFAQRLQDLGGDVNFKTFHGSSHTGHYDHYPIEYRAAVNIFLQKAAMLYPHRSRQLEDIMHDEISEMICDLQEAAVDSNQSLRKVASGPGDHFFVSGTAEHDERAEKSVLMDTAPGISAHSVLGKMLFDVCVPRNVEGWDVRFCSSLNGQPIGSSARRHSPPRGIKGIRRSRL